MALPATYRREKVEKVIEAIEEHAKWMKNVPDNVMSREFRLGALVGLRYALNRVRFEFGIEFDDSLFEFEKEE